MPKVQLHDQQLYLGQFGTWDWKGPVAKVVFHGIFENDLPGAIATRFSRKNACRTRP